MAKESDFILPDFLAPGIRLLICGYNPGPTSARRGHYYANKGNLFWWILHETGLTAVALSFQRDREILDYGVGLTDLHKFSVHPEEPEMSASIRHRLKVLVERYRPNLLAFAGRKPFGAFFGRQASSWGLQPHDTCIGATPVFVAPSTSPRNRARFAQRDYRAIWLDLRRVLDGQQGRTGEISWRG